VSNGIGGKTPSGKRPVLPRLQTVRTQRQRSESKTPKLHELPVTGPVAAFFRHWQLPASRDEVSQVMRFCIRNKDGDGAATLVKALFERDGDGALTLRLGCPAPGDEQGPLADDDLKFLVRWINEWMPELPGGPVALDLSGNDLTAKGLTRLCACLHKNPRMQALDLSRNRFLTPALPRPDTARKALHRKLTSPRRPKAPLRTGDAIGDLLTSGSLRRLWLNGIPFAREDRELILHAVVGNRTLCALGMSGCALSEADIKILVQQDGSKGWRHLALGAKLTEAALKSITGLLLTSETLETLDLETTEPYSFLTVTELFHALGGNHRLKHLSVAGHSLRGNGTVVTEVLQKNTCLRRLDMSGSDISMELLEALVRALSRQEGFKPNETLTTLILPEFAPGTVDHDKKELIKAKISFAINRNRASLFEQLQANALTVFPAGCSSARTLPPELLSGIVGYLQDDERALRALGNLVRTPDPAPETRAAPKTWREARSPRI
jgi:hypothetical protein